MAGTSLDPRLNFVSDWETTRPENHWIAVAVKAGAVSPDRAPLGNNLVTAQDKGPNIMPEEPMAFAVMPGNNPNQYEILAIRVEPGNPKSIRAAAAQLIGRIDERARELPQY